MEIEKTYKRIARTQKIIEAYRGGNLTVEEIARRFKVCAATVSNTVKTNAPELVRGKGYAGPSKYEGRRKRKEMVQSLLKQGGITMADIARRTGITRQRVAQIKKGIKEA